jgi:hypothetical protein
MNHPNEISNISPIQFHNKLNYLRGLNVSPSIPNYEQVRNTNNINQLAFPPNSYGFNFMHHSRSASASPK